MMMMNKLTILLVTVLATGTSAERIRGGIRPSDRQQEQQQQQDGRVLKGDNGGGGNVDTEVPFETHPGSCETVQQIYAKLPDPTTVTSGLIFTDFDTFNQTCGYYGSCFVGQEEGCCRFANGRVVECDLDREFSHALCVCNEFTAPQDRVDPPVPAPVAIPMVPTISPEPTQAPSPLADNCIKYKTEFNPYSVVPGFDTCTENADCPGEVCCLRNFCYCQDESTMHLPCTA